MLHQHFQNILSWLCTDVEHLSSGATDEVFKLSTHDEARMASEIFAALGFKVKIYDEIESSRLYITKPRLDKLTLTAKLESARAYAVMLKQIQESVQTLRLSQKEINGFVINLATDPNSSFKVTVTTTKQKLVKDSDTPSDTLATTEPVPPVKVRAATQARPSASKRPAKDDFGQVKGPAIAKTHLMQDGANKGKEKGATSRWFYRYFFRHFMTNSAQILIVVILLMALSAVMVTSKAFLCPDFAIGAASTPWYCDRIQIRQKIFNEKPRPKILGIPQ